MSLTIGAGVISVSPARGKSFPLPGTIGVLTALLYACASRESPPQQTAAVPEWDAYLFDGSIGATRTDTIRAVRARAENGAARRETFTYEPPQGWTIVSFDVKELSKINDAGYTTSLLAKESNFANEERVRQIAREVSEYSVEATKKYTGEQKAAASSEDVYSRVAKVTSRNNHLSIPWYAVSHQRRIANVVVDNRQASLNFDVIVTLGRVLTDRESEIIAYRMKRAIDTGRDPVNAIP